MIAEGFEPSPLARPECTYCVAKRTSLESGALDHSAKQPLFFLQQKQPLNKQQITFLLNWQATPYHAPIYLAQSKGYFKEEGIDVAILEPSNPSDVTELIGTGKADLGLKAMIHTLAAKARNYPVTSIGSLLDEPFTGILYLEESGITDFQSLKGKRIGYVGEFGKIQLDELTKHYGMTPDDYTAVRCGMNVARDIIDGSIHAGIGIENVQQVMLEEHLKSQGKDPRGAKMMRIDELACLGCCCFCTILYIGNDDWLAAHPKETEAFMRAIKRATDYVINDPNEAFSDYCRFKTEMGTDLNQRIFERSFAYFSATLHNVHRDWKKVTAYGKRIEVLDPDFVANYTNKYLGWEEPEDNQDPLEIQRAMAKHQENCRINGGYRRLVMA
ncbi:pyrimidine precursor biosynthesis enzyme [Nadsonia fulvescens var. elongata DSM 6958]|uniref:4-amino-5-hydroxymethyl-2-methylpyrimidine phosphate synthase n=1 Tax=Nadsonia fulvescens var. elongata DSM 6958 TaxID=857566 RepID=A0A1E3PF75_9ASCO|nr:pyrimidine precursor biosynthesis enzyme [Nadsonia fulvescens var. elongata DSM 6958]